MQWLISLFQHGCQLSSLLLDGHKHKNRALRICFNMAVLDSDHRATSLGLERWGFFIYFFGPGYVELGLLNAYQPW